MGQVVKLFQFQDRPKVSLEAEFRRAKEMRRVLDPVFLFQGRPVVWVCSECNKLFYLRMDEMFSGLATLQYVESEFRQHSCTSPVPLAEQLGI